MKRFLVQEVIYIDRYVEAVDEDHAYFHVKYGRKHPESEVLQPLELDDTSYASDTQFERADQPK